MLLQYPTPRGPETPGEKIAIVTSRQAGGGNRAKSPFAFLGLGAELATPVVLFVFAGYWLDRRLETTPWFLILGAFLGMAVGIYTMFRRLIPPKEDENRKTE